MPFGMVSGVSRGIGVLDGVTLPCEILRSESNNNLKRVLLLMINERPNRTNSTELTATGQGPLSVSSVQLVRCERPFTVIN